MKKNLKTISLFLVFNNSIRLALGVSLFLHWTLAWGQGPGGIFSYLVKDNEAISKISIQDERSCLTLYAGRSPFENTLRTLGLSEWFRNNFKNPIHDIDSSHHLVHSPDAAEFRQEKQVRHSHLVMMVPLNKENLEKALKDLEKIGLLNAQSSLGLLDEWAQFKKSLINDQKALE